MLKIAILGITGSIGKNAQNVIENHPDRFSIVFASAHNNKEELSRIGSRFSIPELVLTSRTQEKTTLLRLIEDRDYDILLNAVSGSAGLLYTMKALETGKRIALANKESLVMAGHLIKRHPNKDKIIPVDSEHSAIFQALSGADPKTIKKLYITASGGAFRDLPLSEFKNITVKKALNHPTWDMGRMITIDSATMFNKALEVIEAHWLFNLPYSRITPIMHPQSVIHSMVEYIDGSIIAQLSNPSMQLPILYAFTYPERIESSLVETNFFEYPALNFREIDPQRYPLFYFTVESAKQEGLIPAILNAANEAAVNLFLQEKIAFTQITDIVIDSMNRYSNVDEPGIEEIIETNRRVYTEIIKQNS